MVRTAQIRMSSLFILDELFGDERDAFSIDEHFQGSNDNSEYFEAELTKLLENDPNPQQQLVVREASHEDCKKEIEQKNQRIKELEQEVTITTKQHSYLRAHHIGQQNKARVTRGE